MHAAWRSDAGKMRDNNEDYLLADPELGLFFLADGMGGAEGGEVASELAVRTAYDFLKDRIAGTEADLPRLLAEALAAAHSAVSKKALAEPALTGMGTTLDMAVIKGSRLYVCHVGDSRVYLVREGHLHRMTTDDNVAVWLMKQEHLSAEEVPPGAWHVLTQAVGASDELVPELPVLDLRRDDLLVLCSDGLTGMVDDRALESIVEGERGDLDRTVSLLVEEANARGGADNITVIIVEPQIEPPGPLLLA